MNYILIANVKDKIIENKYLEQFKGYMKVYDTGNAYILKLKNSNLKFESILCKLTLEIISKYQDRGIVVIDMTDTYEKINATIKNEKDINMTDKRIVMPIRMVITNYIMKKTYNIVSKKLIKVSYRNVERIRYNNYSIFRFILYNFI